MTPREKWKSDWQHARAAVHLEVSMPLWANNMNIWPENRDTMRQAIDEATKSNPEICSMVEARDCERLRRHKAGLRIVRRAMP